MFVFWQKEIVKKTFNQMFVTLTMGVNFTNILQIAFLYEIVLHSTHVLTVWDCNFRQIETAAKAGCKMLVKLTMRVNFTNIL